MNQIGHFHITSRHFTHHKWGLLLADGIFWWKWRRRKTKEIPTIHAKNGILVLLFIYYYFFWKLSKFYSLFLHKLFCNALNYMKFSVFRQCVLVGSGSFFSGLKCIWNHFFSVSWSLISAKNESMVSSLRSGEKIEFNYLLIP